MTAWMRRREFECGDAVEFRVDTPADGASRWRPGTVCGYSVAEDCQTTVVIRDDSGFVHHREVARVRRKSEPT